MLQKHKPFSTVSNHTPLVQLAERLWDSEEPTYQRNPLTVKPNTFSGTVLEKNYMWYYCDNN